MWWRCGHLLFRQQRGFVSEYLPVLLARELARIQLPRGDVRAAQQLVDREHTLVAASGGHAVGG